MGEEGGGSLTASASSYFISLCPYIIILSRQLPKSVVGGEDISGLEKGPGRLMEDRAISGYKDGQVQPLAPCWAAGSCAAYRVLTPCVLVPHTPSNHLHISLLIYVWTPWEGGAPGSCLLLGDDLLGLALPGCWRCLPTDAISLCSCCAHQQFALC